MISRSFGDHSRLPSGGSRTTCSVDAGAPADPADVLSLIFKAPPTLLGTRGASLAMVARHRHRSVTSMSGTDGPASERLDRGRSTLDLQPLIHVEEQAVG